MTLFVEFLLELDGQQLPFPPRITLSALLIGNQLVPLITDAVNSLLALLRPFLSSVQVENFSCLPG